MDFSFSEEQQAAREAARGVFSSVAPDAVPSPVAAAGPVADDFDRPLWRRLAEADLVGLVTGPEYGGAGLDPIALCLVLAEAGGVLARVPLLETGAAALALQRYAPDELRQSLLPEVGRGGTVLTVAAAGRTGHEPAERAVRARPVRTGGGGWLLDGVQTAVPWPGQADHVLVPAHPADDEGRAVLAVLPREADGMTWADQLSTNGERYGELRLESVRVDAGRMVDAAGAWEWLRDLLTVGTCALALGVARQVVRMTGEYVGKREQFGHPLATFQAVAMQMADRYIDTQAMEATLWQAAWRLGDGGATDGLPVAADVAVAKVWASDGVRRVTQTAQHLHGGFGADIDYPLHRYHAWAKQLELSLGPAAAHEEALGDLLAAHPPA
ncbi:MULTISPECIES: acyl-CoA dehydrogenase family protein [Streptomycetaceae]|uniref:Acyl-CoA dehydrogenase n=1 Tax=Streptantibioticus cattleyicolor (strain ATCC 35852 / DSM 46488 / JCM 4925 / NBRC 14057 / NRRL 8057) TaxID=1003195 RepID=F8JSC1_STREN|nr:acyl-CoA dehydrogenase family protein [Streptantibioticus cattleyicolor]AEW95435.1 acyl-CoA dehydrogenase [Streptantibioticus cattleyicolor NRRL 8057 = DSM 46488]MYS60004.1 acyl-CoA dehydrogenase [Streptomyces sp. SID5468]CCB75778.1 Acyl-CoA dehydrogenase [Streptantibioticus cattleyicolor NRRL 8057 = DSM 46488]